MLLFFSLSFIFVNNMLWNINCLVFQYGQNMVPLFHAVGFSSLLIQGLVQDKLLTLRLSII